MNSFSDEPLGSIPSVGRGGLFRVEDPVVPFFPNGPKSEARE